MENNAAKISGGSGCIWSSVFLLELVILVTNVKWDNLRSRDLVNVAKSCDANELTWGNILENHGSNSLGNSNSTETTMLGPPHGSLSVKYAPA